VLRSRSAVKEERQMRSTTKKKASRGRQDGRKGRKVTAKQEDFSACHYERPLETPFGVKQRGDAMPSAPTFSARVQLAETDEAAPRGGELEGCALHCIHGTEVTLAATKPTAGPRSHVPKTVAEALSRSDGPEWGKALVAEVDSCLGACLELGVWWDCELLPGKQALPSHFIM
jgi:hypothetical protein